MRLWGLGSLRALVQELEVPLWREGGPLGFRALGFRGLGFRGLGFRGFGVRAFPKPETLNPRP